jgi:hypothetical protein
MLILDATTKSITVAMASTATTTNPDFVTAYSDDTGTAFTEGSSDGTLNGTTQVTLVSAPAASTRRLIKSIFIENRDTVANTLTITLNNASTLRNIVKVTLNVGDTWTTDGTFDTYGNLKQTIGTVNLSSGVTGTLAVANGGTGVTTSTGTGNTVLSTSPTLTTPLLGTPTSGNLTTCTADGTNAVGYRNIPLSGTKTASYTLVVGDVGKFVILGTSGLVVIPASVFAIGDAISVVNNTTASITCTSSAITAYLGGTNTIVTSFSLATRGVCTILFVTTSVVFITGNVS